MNQIEINVLKPDTALHTFAETWHAAEAGQEMVPKLTLGSLRELFSDIRDAA